MAHSFTNSRGPSRKTLSFFAGVSITLSSSAATTPAVNLNWAAKTTGQQACVTAAAEPITVELSLTNANTVLYTYALDVKNYELHPNDASSLSTGTGVARNLPTHDDNQQLSCDPTAYNNSLEHLWSNKDLFPKSGESIPLLNTQTALTNDADAIETLQKNRSCQTDPTFKAPTADLAKANRVVLSQIAIYQKLNSADDAGKITFPYQIDNKHSNKFVVTEHTRWSDDTTKASLSWRCGADDVLTLSIGTMMTTLPYRTYVHQTVPVTGTGTTTTKDELVTNGNSNITPQGLALLNYKLYDFDRGPEPGFSFSAGPAFKFGGSPSVSSFGIFTGLSLSLWRRVFVSAGMHLGEFADYPTGFHDGSPIPAGFGTLTPVTRWSGRFAGGVTFQTNSFAKSKQDTPATGTAEQKKKQ